MYDPHPAWSDDGAWQRYMDSIEKTLAALPVTAPQAASGALVEHGALAPSTALQRAGNDSYVRLYADAVKTAAYPLYRLAAGKPERISGYGEQCADTDGLAAADVQWREIQRLEERMFHFIGEVKVRDERIAQLKAERDALRTELAQRMAIPARALRP